MPWKVSAAMSPEAIRSARSGAQRAQLEAAVKLVRALEHAQRVAGGAGAGTRLSQRPGEHLLDRVEALPLEREGARLTEAVAAHRATGGGRVPGERPRRRARRTGG